MRRTLSLVVESATKAHLPLSGRASRHLSIAGTIQHTVSSICDCSTHQSSTKRRVSSPCCSLACMPNKLTSTQALHCEAARFSRCPKEAISPCPADASRFRGEADGTAERCQGRGSEGGEGGVGRREKHTNTVGWKSTTAPGGFALEVFGCSQFDQIVLLLMPRLLLLPPPPPPPPLLMLMLML